MYLIVPINELKLSEVKSRIMSNLKWKLSVKLIVLYSDNVYSCRICVGMLLFLFILEIISYLKTIREHKNGKSEENVNEFVSHPGNFGWIRREEHH